MRSLQRTIVVATAAAVLLGGCAVRVPRDDFGKFNAILEPEDWTVIDWRFPTATSQGPLEGPHRLRPELPAIGVPWATGNPQDAPSARFTPAGGDATATATPPATTDARSCDRACEP